MNVRRRLGRTGIEVGALGFGGYRTQLTTPAHLAALRLALARGIDVVDTASSYREGASERLVGKALQDADAGPGAVTVVTKVGGGMEPGRIDIELAGSLGRLGRPRVEVYLLDSPEAFVAALRRRRDPRPLRVMREILYERLGHAFVELERLRAAGRIGWYGVSSDGLSVPVEHPGALSLERLLVLAQRAGGAHHGFAVVEVPLNLLESGAALGAGGSGAPSLLEQARAHDLGVLANRPLNALHRGELARLADPVPRAGHTSLDDGLAFVAALEREWRSEHAPALGPEAAGWFAWSDELGRAFRAGAIHGLPHLCELEERGVWPAVAEALADAAGAAEWGRRYRTALQALLDALHDAVAARTREAYAPLRAALTGALPGWPSADSERLPPLSQVALRTVLDTPGVSCVLVGARRPAYVEDALAAWALPPVPDALELYHALRAV